MDKYLDLDEWFTCPDCGESVQGYELQQQHNGETIYVCPECGCVQENSEVERQLGKEDE